MSADGAGRTCRASRGGKAPFALRRLRRANTAIFVLMLASLALACLEASSVWPYVSMIILAALSVAFDALAYRLAQQGGRAK